MIREDLRAVGKPPGAELPKAIRKLEIGEGRMVEARDLHGDGLCLSKPSEIGGESLAAPEERSSPFIPHGSSPRKFNPAIHGFSRCEYLV